MGKDSSSAITINFQDLNKTGHNQKQLTQKKLDQLAHARVRSLEVRRRAQAAKLQGKLTHLQSMLGSDMRPDTVERIAKEMLAQEEKHSNEIIRLRERQATSTEQLMEAFSVIRNELKHIREAQPGPIVKKKKEDHKTLSEVSLRSSIVSAAPFKSAQK